MYVRYSWRWRYIAVLKTSNVLLVEERPVGVDGRQYVTLNGDKWSCVLLLEDSSPNKSLLQLALGHHVCSALNLVAVIAITQCSPSINLLLQSIFHFSSLLSPSLLFSSPRFFSLVLYRIFTINLFSIKSNNAQTSSIYCFLYLQIRENYAYLHSWEKLSLAIHNSKSDRGINGKRSYIKGKSN